MSGWKYCELHVHIKDWDERLQNPYAKGYKPRDPFTVWVIVNYYTPQGIEQKILLEKEIPDTVPVIAEARNLLPRCLAHMGTLGWEVAHVVHDGIRPAWFLLKKPISSQEE